MSRSFLIYTVLSCSLLAPGCRPGEDTGSENKSDAESQGVISPNSDDRPRLGLDNFAKFNSLVVNRDPARQIKFYYLDKSRTALVVESYEKAIVRDAAGGTNPRFARGCIVGAKDAASAYAWLQSKKAFLTNPPLGVSCSK